MVLSSTLTDIGFVDAAVVALLGYAVVFFGLVLLMIVVIGMGKIFIAKEKKVAAHSDAAKAAIEVTGGTFKENPTKYVAENSAITKNSDGTFGVAKTYLAKVGETSYYTMDEAFHAAVASGETLSRTPAVRASPSTWTATLGPTPALIRIAPRSRSTTPM